MQSAGAASDGDPRAHLKLAVRRHRGDASFSLCAGGREEPLSFWAKGDSEAASDYSQGVIVHSFLRGLVWKTLLPHLLLEL